MAKKMIDLMEAAELIGCTRRHLRHLDMSGGLVAQRNAKGHRCYTAEVIQHFIRTSPRYREIFKRRNFEEHYTTTEAARILGCSVKTVENKAKAGEIKHTKNGNRVVFKIDQLKDFLRNNPTFCPVPKWPNEDQRLLSVSGASGYLNVSKTTIRNWVDAGRLPVTKRTAKGKAFFTKATLQFFAAENPGDVERSRALEDLTALIAPIKDEPF